MKEQKARVIALSLFVADLAINIAGFALLPAELTISLFGNTPLPKILPLAVGLAVVLLVSFRLATERNEPVRVQMAVILAVLVVVNAVLVAMGAGLF